ncbi:hypothetical protein N7510_010101 [Penicillium lagena]|uniref:uncharacterized protein n=1 Tax=Penicillium lagena TaxID=94218 RepID=UPI002540457D|nr:uncharacterized protein N7510_010101 [Penicillium lagena]KAJ5604947.1 hypothetical protein N7510_010101 [Penicillium lagena]
MRIAIVGAGPVGLTLARLLLNKPNIDVVVFESEKSREARGQGGSLDLHPDTGLAAVKEAGLWDEFQKRVRYDGEALTVCDKKLTKYFVLSGETEGSSHGRPEIDRRSLRDMLLDSVPPEVIRWGNHLRSIDEDRNLIFDQGTESGFDLVVGADGAWSKIRKLVSDQTPQYSGMGGFRLTIPNAKETAPDSYKLTNRGSIFSYSDGSSIMSQQLGDGSLNVAVWSTLPEDDWMEKLPFDVHDLEAVKKHLTDKLHDWHPELLNIIRHAQDPEARSLYMLPVGWRWENRPGVTLVGDAAHVMTPFAGEGVNLGMQDALMLSRAIITAAGSPEPATQLPAQIKTFEEDLFVRAERTASLTNDSLTWLFFTDGSPRTIIDKWALRVITFHDKTLLDRVRKPLLAASLKTYFFLFKLYHAG